MFLLSNEKPVSSITLSSLNVDFSQTPTKPKSMGIHAKINTPFDINIKEVGQFTYIGSIISSNAGI